MKKQDNRYNIELSEFLDRPFAIDMLYPVFGELSVDTVFTGWTGQKKNNWYEFINSDGDKLEFYPEGTYVIKKNNRKKSICQARIPEMISEYIEDMKRAGIRLF